MKIHIYRFFFKKFITQMKNVLKIITYFVSSASIYIYVYIYILIKSGKHRHVEHWTTVSTLLGLISSAYRDLYH